MKLKIIQSFTIPNVPAFFAEDVVIVGEEFAADLISRGLAEEIKPEKKKKELTPNQ